MEALNSPTVDQLREVLAILRGRVDQHLRFFDTLERIRWQFTSAFGVGAGFGLFTILAGESSITKVLVGHCLVIGLSLAALVTQIRIFALIVIIWTRILSLQEAEFGILRNNFAIQSGLQDALSIPKLKILQNKILYSLTVGMASCFIFALAIGISTALLLDLAGLAPWLFVPSAALTIVLLMIASVIGSKYYITTLETPDDPTRATPEDAMQPTSTKF